MILSASLLDLLKELIEYARTNKPTTPPVVEQFGTLLNKFYKELMLELYSNEVSRNELSLLNQDSTPAEAFADLIEKLDLVNKNIEKMKGIGLEIQKDDIDLLQRWHRFLFSHHDHLTNPDAIYFLSTFLEKACPKGEVQVAKVTSQLTGLFQPPKMQKASKTHFLSTYVPIVEDETGPKIIVRRFIPRRGRMIGNKQSADHLSIQLKDMKKGIDIYVSLYPGDVKKESWLRKQATRAAKFMGFPGFQEKKAQFVEFENDKLSFLGGVVMEETIPCDRLNFEVAIKAAVYEKENGLNKYYQFYSNNCADPVLRILRSAGIEKYERPNIPVSSPQAVFDYAKKANKKIEYEKNQEKVYGLKAMNFQNKVSIAFKVIASFLQGYQPEKVHKDPLEANFKNIKSPDDLEKLCEEYKIPPMYLVWCLLSEIEKQLNKRMDSNEESFVEIMHILSSWVRNQCAVLKEKCDENEKEHKKDEALELKKENYEFVQYMLLDAVAVMKLGERRINQALAGEFSALTGAALSDKIPSWIEISSETSNPVSLQLRVNRNINRVQQPNPDIKEKDEVLRQLRGLLGVINENLYFYPFYNSLSKLFEHVIGHQIQADIHRFEFIKLPDTFFDEKVRVEIQKLLDDKKSSWLDKISNIQRICKVNKVKSPQLANRLAIFCVLQSFAAGEIDELHFWFEMKKLQKAFPEKEFPEESTYFEEFLAEFEKESKHNRRQQLLEEFAEAKNTQPSNKGHDDMMMVIAESPIINLFRKTMQIDDDIRWNQSKIKDLKDNIDKLKEELSKVQRESLEGLRIRQAISHDTEMVKLYEKNIAKLKASLGQANVNLYFDQNQSNGLRETLFSILPVPSMDVSKTMENVIARFLPNENEADNYPIFRTMKSEIFHCLKNSKLSYSEQVELLDRIIDTHKPSAINFFRTAERKECEKLRQEAQLAAIVLQFSKGSLDILQFAVALEKFSKVYPDYKKEEILQFATSIKETFTDYAYQYDQVETVEENSAQYHIKQQLNSYASNFKKMFTNSKKQLDYPKFLGTLAGKLQPYMDMNDKGKEKQDLSEVKKLTEDLYSCEKIIKLRI